MGKGKYLIGILLVLAAGVTFYTCNRKEPVVTEDILPVEQKEKPAVVPEPEVAEPVQEDIKEEGVLVVEQVPVSPKREKKEPLKVVEPDEAPVLVVCPVEPVETIPEEVPVSVEDEPVILERVERDTSAPLLIPETKKTFDRGIKRTVFIPKGLWMAGGTFSYNESSGDNMKLLVLKNMEGRGYSFSVSPNFCYFIKDDIGIGGRFTYTRELIDINNIDIDLNEDLTFNINNAYLLEHMFYGTGFIRMYTSIGNSKILALFNEARLTFGAGQGKTFSGEGTTLDGVYQTMKHLQVGMSPGIAAFITNDLAVDVSIGVLGFDTYWVKQDHNKIIEGSYRNSSAKFKLDVFAINLGLSYYF